MSWKVSYGSVTLQNLVIETSSASAVVTLDGKPVAVASAKQDSGMLLVGLAAPVSVPTGSALQVQLA